MQGIEKGKKCPGKYAQTTDPGGDSRTGIKRFRTGELPDDPQAEKDCGQVRDKKIQTCLEHRSHPAKGADGN